MKTLIFTTRTAFNVIPDQVEVTIKEKGKTIFHDFSPVPRTLIHKNTANDLFVFWLSQIEHKLVNKLDLGRKRNDYTVKYQ